MHKLFCCCRMLGAAAVAAWGLGAIAIPAAAGTIYAWRTESGTSAYTDSIKNVPARYRDQVTTRPSRSIANYERLTPVDATATARYQQQLVARLGALRARNAARMAPLQRAPESAVASNAIMLPTGGEGSPSIRLTASGGEEPIVVETLLTRPAEKMTTRHSTVVRQGDKILAVTKPRTRVWNLANDVVLEDSLR